MESVSVMAFAPDGPCDFLLGPSVLGTMSFLRRLMVDFIAVSAGKVAFVDFSGSSEMSSLQID
jgi:hypothetical protein